MSEASLAGQIALVTGASRGIGAAIAAALAQRGATVIGTATSDAGAASIAEALSPWSGRGVVLNVTDANACEELVKTLGKEVGPISVLVNNAGITRDNIFLRMKDEDVLDVLHTNLLGAVRLSRLVLRGMMKAKTGRIVNISSVVGATGNAGQVNYAASKAGLIGATKSLAAEIGSRGITVNAVAPGFIETDMTNVLDADTRETLLSAIPLGRLGKPDDIAEAVCFLCGPGGGYITGSTLHVNGGMYMA